jgi:uncharacterized membrane protein YgcG
MRRLGLCLLLLIACASPAWAEERIMAFVSAATVNADASLSVHETITVVAEGRQIRRGIFRDFPTLYTDPHGQRVTVGFEVAQVRRNGHAEPYALEPIANGVRVRIGNADVLLDDGPHTYDITYRTTRQIGFFAKYDELYWNVTGNGWSLPIDHARAEIRLPAGADILQHAEYTGSQGEAGGDARVITASGTAYVAETTQPLAPGEGFTIAVGWQKGILTPPSGTDQWRWWLADNAGLFALALGLIASASYFLFAWNRVGRDPVRGTIIPLFTPPQGLSPAAMRYVTRYGADNKGFAAALVGLAVKGRLRIDDDDGGYSITKLSAPASAPALSTSEQALDQSLPQGTTALRQANRPAVQAAKAALESALKDEYEGRVFLRNLGWFAGGLAISVACLIIGGLLLPPDQGVPGFFAIIWMGVWWSAIIGFGWATLKGVLGGRGIWQKISSLAGLLFLVPFIGAGVIAPAMMLLQGGSSPMLYMLLATAAFLGILNVVFYHLLRAPTGSGRKLLDQIEGFRLYLSTAEEERLKVLNPPEKTPELFERYLPYALALDCENEWNAKFAAVLAAAAAAGATGPIWYSGRNWDFGRSDGFTNSLGRSLAASTAAAATAPGRSSGSGGGGSSGGGGGGGGGGGW